MLLLSYTPPISAGSLPQKWIITIENKNAMTKFIKGPASMVAILAHTDFLSKEFSSLSFSSSSSLSIIQYPPNGISLKVYCVSFFLKEKSLGPNPMENSLTVI